MCSSRLIFNILPTDLSTGPIRGDVAWGTDLIPEQNCALKRFQPFSNRSSNQRRAMFLLVGREHANIWIALAAT